MFICICMGLDSLMFRCCQSAMLNDSRNIIVLCHVITVRIIFIFQNKVQIIQGSDCE